MNHLIIEAFVDELDKLGGLPKRLKGPVKPFAEAAATGDPQARRDFARIMAHRQGRKAGTAIQSLRSIRKGEPMRATPKARVADLTQKQRAGGIRAMNERQRVLRGEGERLRQYSRAGDPRSRGRSRGPASRPPGGESGRGPQSAGSPTSSHSKPRMSGKSKALIGAGVAAAALGGYAAYRAKKKRDKDNDWRKEL